MTKSMAIKGVGLAVLAVPLIAFLALLAVPSWDLMIKEMSLHFYVVSFTSIAAAIACGIIIASARTLHETRLLFLGLAFFVIAGVFAVHGFTTPGVLVDSFYSTVAVSAWLSVALGCALVAASAVRLPRKVDAVVEGHGGLVFGGVAALLFAYILLSVLPATVTWLDWVPIGSRGFQLSVGLSGLALVAFAAWRYYQAYQFARLPSQLAMVGALVLLLEVQVMLLWGRSWQLSWWLYHGMYAGAFAVLFTGWAIEVRRAGTLRAIADALSMRDALAQLNRGLDGPILELVDAIEIKDEATFGHVRRVSAHALAIGRRMGLPPGELRALVVAAEMHDVGKISVPASILTKPGPLTEEEFAIVKQHTTRGQEIAEQVDSLTDLADIIRCHHERLDGSGYPDGLVGEEIPMLARIVAVADTYDAMTSNRPYRDAVSHLQAMGEIVRASGATFDARCVQALVDVFADQGSRQAPLDLAA